jgi:hypothetical protein
MNRKFQRDTMFLLRSITMFDKKRNSLSPVLLTFKNVNGGSIVVSCDAKNRMQPKFSTSRRVWIPTRSQTSKKGLQLTGYESWKWGQILSQCVYHRWFNSSMWVWKYNQVSYTVFAWNFCPIQPAKELFKIDVVMGCWLSVGDISVPQHDPPSDFIARFSVSLMKISSRR